MTDIHKHADVGIPESWDELDGATQEALIEWYNLREEDFDTEDYERLATLAHNYQFHHYTCGYCGDKVRQGQPDSWEDFQCVCQDEGVGKLCWECFQLLKRLEALAGNDR